ncbi:MAG TPA: SsrA-binding protein SmpB [Candidatus Paceibacterota bacterium]|nr:SsrA-binding protein [uncultured archaeon]
MSLITNKKAHFNYEITENYAAGIELFGFEVKSLRKGEGSLEGSYVTIRGKEAFLIGSFVPPYQEKNAPKDYDPRRNRKLLLTKKEIKELADIEKTKGLTIVPLSVYNKNRVLKIDLGVGKGKKKYDKRESVKKAEDLRHINREFKDR